jgi:hypothetical protein
MNDIQRALKSRYSHIHPLLFQRSLEKAKTDGQLFDILETMPKEYPIVWDDDNYCWKHTKDLLQGDFAGKT